MKKTLIVILTVSFILNLHSQNLAGNPSFEDDVTTFTVNENDFNVLRRVNAHLDATTQTTNPNSEALNVGAGMWVLKANNSYYPRAVITSDDKYTGLSALHMYIKPGSTTNYSQWWHYVVQQKLVTPLSATKKYKATIWARVDDTPENYTASIFFFLGDKQSGKWMTKKVDLTGGTFWTKYEHIFDIPAHMALPANATSTFNWNEAWAGITLVATIEDGINKYAGILIDDYYIAEEVETSLSEVNAHETPIIVRDHTLMTSKTGQLELFSVNGIKISDIRLSDNESIVVNSGLYIARFVTKDSTYILKLIVE